MNGAMASTPSTSDKPRPATTSRDMQSSPAGQTLPGPGQGGPFLHGVALWVLFVSQCLTSLLITLYVTIIATAIPSITADFHSISDLDWYSTAYLLALCSLQPLSGKFYTLFPLKITFLAFISIFEVGNLICALSRTSAVFIVGRAVAGMGAAGLFTGSITLLIAAADPSIRPTMLGVGTAVSAIGSVVGPIVGGAITQHLGWRWCCWIILPYGAVAASLTMFVRIPEQTKKQPLKEVLPVLPQRLDLLGFALFAGACVMVLLALSWGGQKLAWNSATVVGLLCGSGVTAIIFGVWSWQRQDKALIPPRILKKQVVFFGFVTSFLQGGAFLELGYYLPLWFQSVKQASPTSSGLMLLPTAIAQILASTVSGVLIKKVPYVPPWSLLGNAMSAIGAGLMTTWTPETNEGTWIGYQILVGVGRGLMLQMPIIALQNELSGMDIAIGTAANMFVQYFGGTIFLSIAKSVFSNELRKALLKYAPDIDANKIIKAGATNALKGLSPEDMASVLKAYNISLTKTFWLPTAAGIAAFFASFGLSWKKISTKRFTGGPMPRGPPAGNQHKDPENGGAEVKLGDGPTSADGTPVKGPVS